MIYNYNKNGYYSLYGVLFENFLDKVHVLSFYKYLSFGIYHLFMNYYFVFVFNKTLKQK